MVEALASAMAVAFAFGLALRSAAALGLIAARKPAPAAMASPPARRGGRTHRAEP